MEKDRLHRLVRTYTNNSRIVRHGRGFVFFDAGVFLDSQILHIAATKDDVFVNLVCGSDLTIRPGSPASSTFRTERANIFERDRRVVRIDLVKGTYISRSR